MEDTKKNKITQRSEVPESNYEYLIDRLDVGFFQVTLDGQLIRHNRAHNTILGHESSDEMSNKDVRDFWQNPKQREAYLNHLLTHGFAKNYICHALANDGKKIVLELNSYLIRDEKGDPIRIDGTFKDITDKYSLETRVKESEEKYRSLFDSFPHFIGLMDMKGTLIDCNPAINNFLSRHRREDILGLNFIQILSKIDKNKQLIPKFKELLNDIEKDGKLKSYEFKMHRSAGDHLWLRIEGSVIQFNNQKFIQFIIQDITSRKSIEEMLSNSQTKLQKRVNELSCIYQLSKLIENKHISIESLIQGTLEIIPSSLRYPEITCVRIFYNDKTYTSINFEPSIWKLRVIETINKQTITIEVCYLEDKTFLQEEYDMIREIGIRLKSCIEEREVQRRVKKSEEKYHAIFDTSPDIIYLTDFYGNVLDANPAWFNKVKISKEDTRNVKIVDFFAGDNRDELMNFISEIRAGNVVKGMELKVKHLSGEFSEYEIDSVPMMEDDRIVQVLNIARDITERKEMEKKLKDSEERYRLIYENANDLIRVLNDRFEFEYINEKVHKRILGYSKEDLIGQTHLPFLHPEDRRQAIRSTVRNLKKGEGSYQARFKDKDGDYKWFEFSGTIFFNSQGEKKILSIARDITERKKSEQKLRESEEKYRLISETAYDLIAVMNANFKYEYINETAFKHILGYSKEELMGKSCLKFVHPDDMNLSAKALREGFEKGQWELELRFLHEKGHWVWLEVRGKTFVDKDGHLKGIIISRDFTERKMALEKLRQSEERYRLISQNADENLFIFDMNLNLIYNDTNVPNILGYSYEEIKKLKLTEYNTPSSLKIAIKAYKEELRKERKKIKDLTRIWTVEGEQIHKNGSIVNVETRFTFLRDENGNPTGILGLSRDITNRKQAEQKLRESEEKYRFISETAFDLIGVLNKKFKYEYINEQAYKRILGYTSKDIIGKSSIMFVHPDDISPVSKALFEGFKHGQGGGTLRFKHKNGHWVWIESKGRTYLDKDGELKAIVISRDITERKRAEDALKQRAHQWLTTFNAMSEAVFLLDLEQNILQCNKASLDLFGKSEYDEIVGHQCKEVMIGSCQADDWCPVERMKLTGKIETSIIKMDNKWLQASASPVFDDKNNIIGTVHVISDITGRKTFEDILKKSEKKYREAYNRANFYKDLFAHDINNILQIISSSSELISIQLGDSEKSEIFRNLTKIVSQQVERGGKLVRNVHTLSKLEEESVIIKQIKICDTLKQSIEFVKSAYEDRNLQIQVDSLDSELIVNSNAFLQDVFENVLINSVKYNEKSNVEILIKISKIVLDDTNHVKMEFIDNGIGVPDERKEIIFKRGNRELKGDKGMGLGLSLVSKILKLFNGKIWVEDKIKGEYYKGSDFVILLPVAD